METIENNKLIAEFMGLPINHYGDYNIDKNIMGFDMIVCSPADTKFHSSWDWLMPVVQKCYKIDDEEGFDNLVDAVSTLDFDAIYQAVVEFIKKYNEEKN